MITHYYSEDGPATNWAKNEGIFKDFSTIANTTLMKVRQSMTGSSGDFYKYLEQKFDPGFNEFKVVKIGSPFPPGGFAGLEVWTDGTSLLIDQVTFEEGR
jgi:hypothetical protein